MLERLKRGEDPLSLSIQKWKDIVVCLDHIRSLREFDQELERGAENCALCEVYKKHRCRGCPIFEWTRVPECITTPYYMFRFACWNRRYSLMRYAAVRELKFLKNLQHQAVKCIGGEKI